MNIFDQVESNVRSYCRSFPVMFNRAKGDLLYEESGRSYIDFFAGAGALNYGHNNDVMKAQIIEYLNADGIMHGLDMFTQAKKEFIITFAESLLKPRGLDYKIQFCGPTGTNAVEAALKLARKTKGRTGVFSFMGGYHGMSLGSLAVTSNKSSRNGGGLPLNDVTFIPYGNGPFGEFDSIAYLEQIMQDTHSGIEKPAAIIYEAVQAEGGVYVADPQWLRKLRDWCDRHDVLLICDDIQVGCGRTGAFFSFERAGIQPDLVVLSKSISGIGLPMSLLLIRPDLDIWTPGEHNGTFRGNQLAFIAAKVALDMWAEQGLQEEIAAKEAYVREFLEQEIKPLHPAIDIRGVGLIWGVDMAKVENGELAGQMTAGCFADGLVIERAGRNDTVIKLMPPLTVSMDNLRAGCEILKRSISLVLEQQKVAVAL